MWPAIHDTRRFLLLIELVGLDERIFADHMPDNVDGAFDAIELLADNRVDRVDTAFSIAFVSSQGFPNRLASKPPLKFCRCRPVRLGIGLRNQKVLRA
jgi:hypothetical protein